MTSTPPKTPGEEDVERINATRDPTRKLRGASAEAHEAKVNRELGVSGDTGEEESAPTQTRRRTTSRSRSSDRGASKQEGPHCHVGDPHVESCDNPALDKLPAQFGGHMLYGGAAKAHEAKWYKDHPQERGTTGLARTSSTEDKPTAADRQKEFNRETDYGSRFTAHDTGALEDDYVPPDADPEGKMLDSAADPDFDPKRPDETGIDTTEESKTVPTRI